MEIREKYSFEDDKLSARHSPGVCYFQSGALLKEYCKKLISGGPAINGEYCASLPYNYMVNDGLKVWCPVNVDKFCQWGTPEDLQEYEFWIGRIKGLMMEKVDDKDVGTRKKWHSGFKEALIVQFEPYHDVLEFDFEHKLTSEALRIDAVIIKKKDDVQIENDIGCNFHKYNILEYKSPEDYFSIKDLWKTMSYAYLYASIENDVEPDSITVTIIRTGGSKSVLKYLKNRGYDVEEKVDDKKQETGIYLVKGLCLPLQIIDSEKLPEEGNLWLKNLRGNLDVATLQKILEESGKGGRLPMLEAFLQVVSEANEQGIEEVLKMRSAKLDEIFHRNGYLTIEEVEAERKQAETERKQAEADRKQAEAQRQAFEATLRSLGLPSDQIAAALRV
ncbi:hypothetical protein FACS189494_00710 [Spirochaetia bacterium]|nr:hypothetical protein FACS189494_00710 [Spirochaetia bacterium]